MSLAVHDVADGFWEEFFGLRVGHFACFCEGDLVGAIRHHADVGC